MWHHQLKPSMHSPNTWRCWTEAVSTSEKFTRNSGSDHSVPHSAFLEQAAAPTPMAQTVFWLTPPGVMSLVRRFVRVEFPSHRMSSIHWGHSAAVKRSLHQRSSNLWTPSFEEMYDCQQQSICPIANSVRANMWRCSFVVKPLCTCSANQLQKLHRVSTRTALEADEIRAIWMFRVYFDVYRTWNWSSARCFLFVCNIFNFFRQMRSRPNIIMTSVWLISRHMTCRLRLFRSEGVSCPSHMYANCALARQLWQKQEESSSSPWHHECCEDGWTSAQLQQNWSAVAIWTIYFPKNFASTPQNVWQEYEVHTSTMLTCLHSANP